MFPNLVTQSELVELKSFPSDLNSGWMEIERYGEHKGGIFTSLISVLDMAGWLVRFYRYKPCEIAYLQVGYKRYRLFADSRSPKKSTIDLAE